jgi:lysophospholipase L1-like esterase
MITSLSHATGSSPANIIWLYPKEFEYLEAKNGKEWLSDRAEIDSIAAAAGVTVVDIANQPEWNETLYRADGVHPTVEGNAVLANILAAAFRNSLNKSGDVRVQPRSIQANEQ